MDLSPTDQFAAATRHDGWTPERKARFLALLAENGNVRLSARRCGLSPQSAYVQRRRDPLFARGWASALVLARHAAEQVLADRAIDGVVEEIWYRGELVGTRRRYDGRLLLAHLARLDRQAEAAGAEQDAARFDELVALVAGMTPPAALGGDAEALPPVRAVHADEAALAAQRAAVEAELDEEEAGADADANGNASQDPDIRAFDRAMAEIGSAARAAAHGDWDGWHAAACAAADRLAHAADACALDRVNGSTSAGAEPTAPADRALGTGHPQHGDRSVAAA